MYIFHYNYHFYPYIIIISPLSVIIFRNVYLISSPCEVILAAFVQNFVVDFFFNSNHWSKSC